MSLIKPDMDYDPTKRMDMYIPGKSQTIMPEKLEKIPTTSKEEFHQSLQLFMNNFEDMDFIRFYNLSKITFKTSINVQDSVSFFEKFSTLYVGALKKNFPSKNLEQVEKSLSIIKTHLAEILKHDNVENKFLLPMLIGMTEGILNDENY